MNHGYTANHYIDYQFTDIFFEEGYNVLLIDMRSHGESEGKVASYGYNESKDIGSWVRWIKDKIGEDAYIGLHGQSMGAATVMLYGATHPNDIKFVIEDCGFTSAREAIKFQFRKVKIPFWPLYDLIRVKVKRKYKFDFNNISPEDAIVNSDIPVLFIHGDNDKVVPTWMGEALYNEKNGEMDRLYLVQGAGHMEAYSKDKEKYKQVVKEFLDNIK
ncbi:alpha/beta hydrolase [Clostridium sp. NSJ-49]|nr:alpha/beta hydrolase [Clostridium sp. NSJ-49]MBC5624240.1 alpha/beta hydrolase [Clostridium sp. NSJ-49]